MAEKTKKSKSVFYYLNDLREGFVDYAHVTGIDSDGKRKTFDVFALKDYLGTLEKDAKLYFGNDDVKGEWVDLFETKDADGGETMKLRFKVEFTVATLSRGLSFGFSKATDPKGATSDLVNEMYGATIKNFLLTGERKIFYPKAEKIAETLLNGLVRNPKKSLNDVPDWEWRGFIARNYPNFTCTRETVENDIARCHNRWCVTDCEYVVGMFDIFRQRTGGILWLLQNKNPELWNESMVKLDEMCKTELLRVRDGVYVGSMLRGDVETIHKIKSLILKKANEGHLVLFVGRAGTGKSENAVKRAKDVSGDSERWTYVALSNSVCSMGATRAQKKCHMSISPSSIARCRVCSTNPNVIEDEFSQWGMAELELFLKLLEDSKEMIIMGDDRQIPSFLGRGCLLHDVRELLERECSRAVIHLKEVKRADSPELINSVLAFSETANINSLSQWFCESDPEDAVRDWGRNLPKNGIIISGANVNVDMLNWRMFAYWLRKFLDDEVLDDGERQILLDAISAIKKNGDPDEKDEVTKDYDAWHQGLATPQVVDALRCVFSHYDDTLPVLMKKVEDLCAYDDINKPKKHCVFCYGHTTDEKNMNFKRFLVSERAEIVNVMDNGYLMKNDRGGELLLPFDKARLSVAPGFAITVNKAQGLEWDDVLVYIPRIAKSNYNLVSANAFYVAASRSRSSLKIIPSNKSSDSIRPFESFTNAFDITLASA